MPNLNCLAQHDQDHVALPHPRRPCHHVITARHVDMQRTCIVYNCSLLAPARCRIQSTCFPSTSICVPATSNPCCTISPHAFPTFWEWRRFPLTSVRMQHARHLIAASSPRCMISPRAFPTFWERCHFPPTSIRVPTTLSPCRTISICDTGCGSSSDSRSV